MPRKKLPLTGFDAVVCMALAVHTHACPKEVKRVAVRVMKLMRRKERGLLAPVIATQNPHALIWQTLKELDHEQPPLPSVD